jgi:hypothetical protein
MFGFQHGKAKRGNSGEASGVRFLLAEDGDPLQEQGGGETSLVSSRR